MWDVISMDAFDAWFAALTDAEQVEIDTVVTLLKAQAHTFAGPTPTR